MTEQKTRRQELEERKEQKKAVRSLASVRAKTRMGVKPVSRSKQREVPSFEIKRTYAEDEQKTTVPPRRMLDFWLNFQERQRRELKMAGVSTTGYKITDVRIVFDSQGREQGVKVSFAGGGSVRDFGDKLCVFHNVRRKKPRFNKLFALLQAIKERGWAAVEGEIPPEMRAIVLRACKRVGIPLNPKEKPKHNARATMYFQNPSYGSSGNSYSGAFTMSAEEWKRFSASWRNIFKTLDTDSPEFRQANDKRASEFGGETNPNASKKEIYEAEAGVFFLMSTGMTHEESIAYKMKCSPEKWQQVAEYAKELDRQGDMYVKMQQMAISLDRCLTGRASAEETAWMKQFEEDVSKRTGKPFKFKSLDDLKNVDKKAMNVALNRIGKGKNSLHLDEQFEAESGFHYYNGLARSDLEGPVNVIAATAGYPSIGEYLSLQPKDLPDFESRAQTFHRERQQQREANKRQKEGPTRQIPVIEKLPKDREAWKTFEGMARKLGYSPEEIAALQKADKGNPDKKNINRTMSYYGTLLRVHGQDGKTILKKLNAFIAAPDEMKKKMAAQIQADYTQKKEKDVSTLDMMTSLKKHQKRKSVDTERTAGKKKEKTKERQELAGKIINRMAVMKARGGR